MYCNVFYFVGAIKVEMYGAYLYTEKYLSILYVFMFEDYCILRVKRYIYSGKILNFEKLFFRRETELLLKSNFLKLKPVRRFKRYYNQT